MKSREFDPLHLDVAAFAKEGLPLDGEWPCASLERLAASVWPGSADASPPVSWHLTGQHHAPAGRDPEVRLQVKADAQVRLECQRCLKPMDVAVHAERAFLFVRDEATAAALDADSEEDVLALTRALNARELVEDELLLELPIVPRHDECPEPLAVAADDLPEDDTPHPFAKLAALKRGGLPN